MIEHLTGRDFQGHRKVSFSIDPRLTCIVGPSDTGKTSLFRLLELICLNQSTGDDVRHGAQVAKGNLIVDGKTITRKKGKGTNLYYLDDKKFKTPGTKVPDEIAKLLNVGEVNFQRQHDPMFWFSRTPGQFAKDLNKIINLELIDSSLDKVASKVRQAKSKVDLTHERLQTARKERDSLSFVVELHAKKQKLEEIELRMTEKYLLLEIFTKLLENYDDLEQKRGEISAIDGVERLDKLKTRIENKEKLCKELSDQIEMYEILKHSLQKAERERIDAESKLKGISRCPVCGKSMT